MSASFGFIIPEGLRSDPLPLRRDRPYTTREIRQAWVSSFKSETVGNRLPVRKLPICCLRQQMNRKRFQCKSADPNHWMSEDDKRKIAEKRKHFDRQWSAEITKRNETPRPVYTITLRPPTPPVKKFITAPCNGPDSLFRKAGTHRPKTREEKSTSSRHFVSPEWKSEFVSWKRFNRTSLDIHRLSVF